MVQLQVDAASGCRMLSVLDLCFTVFAASKIEIQAACWFRAGCNLPLHLHALLYPGLGDCPLLLTLPATADTVIVTPGHFTSTALMYSQS